MFLKSCLKTAFIMLLNIFCFLAFVSAEGPGSALEYFHAGQAAESAGDFYKAVEMYKSALNYNSKFFNAVNGLAHAYYGLDEFDESLKYVLQAEKLDSKNTDLMNLKGRIYLNKGDFKKAKEIFAEVLSYEENNIDAEFGLAELDIASGRIKTAATRYENVLLVSPESRKALLALVMIKDDAGDLADAEIYLWQALKFYSNNAFVHYIAAKHFYRKGDTEEALYHLETALFLQTDFPDASILLCEIYMQEHKYDEVRKEIEKVLNKHRNEYILWYMLGRAYEDLGDSANAISSYARVLNIRPDEDLSRIALENEIISKMPMDSDLRVRYAEYHIDLGLKYEARNMLEKALKEYRRALVINPYSYDARLLYADIFKRKDYIERYLLILSALVKDGYGNTDIQDEIEIRKSMIDSTISEKWDTDQFSADKEENHISVFFSSSGMSHIEGEYILSEYMEFLLNGYENIVVDTNNVSDDFAFCFRTARENNSDYFIIFECRENPRAVSISADIYIASTGNLMQSLNFVRTGNQMIPEAGKTVSDSIHSLLPVYGRIIDRKFDEVLVNLGLNEGTAVGDEFLVIKKGAISRSKNNFDLDFDKSAVIGTYTVQASDELISDGSVKIKGFFDMINPGDIIYKKGNQEDAAAADGTDDAQMFYSGNLFDSIRNIP